MPPKRRSRRSIESLAFIVLSMAGAWGAPFPTVESLNDYIEGNWGKEAMRKDLYALAQDGVRRFPKNAEILGRQAFLEYQMGTGDWGAALVTRALAMDPDHWMIRIWAENIYVNRAFNESSADAAVDLFDKAEKLGFRKDDLYRLRGSALHDLARYPEAERDFRQALEMSPMNPHTLYAFASLRHDMGDLPGWARLLEDFLLVDDQAVRDNEVNVRENLAPVYAERFQRLGDARMHYEALIHRYPDHGDRIGWEKALLRLSTRSIRGSWTVAPSAGADPAKGIEVMLPVESAYQRLESVAFDPKPSGQTFTKRGGNNYALLAYPGTPDRITVSFRMTISAATVAEGGFVFDGEDDPAPYAGRDTDYGTLLDPSDPELKRLVAEIAGGIADPLEKARRIHDWIWGHFQYKVVYPGSIAEYLRVKQGECGGFALVFVALCRAAGIPARRAFSPLFEFPDAKTFGSHATSEFWVQGKGWIPVNNTANVFAATSDVLSLWRNVADGKRGGTLYPELRDIRIEYEGPRGEKVVLQGG